VRRAKKIGRPRLPKGELRQYRLTVFLTDAEHRKLRSLAAGTKLGERARELLVAALEREGR